MRKFALHVSSILLTCAFAFNADGQSSRPRRTGNNTPPTPSAQTPPAQTQDNASSGDYESTTSNAPELKGKGSDNGIKTNSQATAKQTQEVGEDEVVRVETTLVTLPVTVQDREGRYIPDLRKENFRVYENGVEQQVAYFGATESPFTVALLIDTSSSARFKFEDIQDAAIAFVDQLRPGDRVMVISFDDKIRVLSEATNDRYALRSAIQRARVGGGTRFYDAVEFALRKMSAVEGRKAMVLFTDGVDTTSKQETYQSTLHDAEEADTLVYSLEYDTFNDTNSGGGGGSYPPYPPQRPSSGSVLGDILGGVILGSPRGGGGRGGRGGGGGGIPGGGGGAGSTRAEYERADQYLRDISNHTGGRFERAETLGDIQQSFAVIAEELRRQYSVGYYPKQKPTPGERRQIRVRVDRPNLIARTRESYTFGQPNAKQNGKTQTVKNSTQDPKKTESKGTLPPYIF